MNATQPRTTLHEDSEPATDCPLVSVIIPYYNGSDYIDQAVQSALAQTYTNLQVIIVNDGSPDGSGEQLDKRYENEPRVTVLHQENAGTAAARNTGIRHAKGSLIALLDQDDHWLPRKIERQVPLFDSQQTGMVHTGGQAYDQQTKATTASFRPKPTMTSDQLIAHCNVSCASSMFRRSVWEKIGGFREHLRGTDDWMFWIELSKAGYDVIGLDEDLVRIRIHDANQGTHVSASNSNAWAAVIQHVEAWPDKSSHTLAAIVRAKARLRNCTYLHHCGKSREAWNASQPLTAVKHRLLAYCYYPKAFMSLPLRVMSKGAGP